MRGQLETRTLNISSLHRSPSMPDTAEELAQRAKQLSPDEREWLVDALLESLNAPATAELDGAWAAEIERRLAADDRGDVTAIPVEEVFAKARAIAK
jgi:putative addiction module component (TIGR02574 family)